MHRHALWLRPFGDVAFDIKQRIKELSDKFDTPVFEPHITLLSGLKHNQTELIQFTDTLAGSLDPFRIELSDMGYHDDYYQSFFVRVKKTTDLEVVQETAAELFDCHMDDIYFPHLSLIYGNISEVKKEELLDEIEPFVHISFPVHSLLLIKTEGDVNEWQKIHTAEFKHQKTH